MFSFNLIPTALCLQCASEAISTREGQIILKVSYTCIKSSPKVYGNFKGEKSQHSTLLINKFHKNITDAKCATFNSSIAVFVQKRP